VTAVACTPDGRFAASIGSDSRLAVWDPLTGEQLFQAEAEGDPAAVAVSPDGRTVAAGGAGIVCWEVPDPRKGPAVTDDAALSRAWDGLTDEAVVPSSAAIRILRRSPAATALLRDKLKPDEEEMARVSTLIKELSADRFPVRESATAALRKTGTKYLAVLRLALETADTEESRRRLRSILGGLEDPAEMYRQRLRTARGVRILARAGTPEARKVLEELAAGDPNWPVTSEARAVLRPGKCVTVRR
jgi:hypothetical protein